MSPPKKISIGPYLYSLQAMPGMADTDGTVGVTYVSKTLIRYDSEQSPAMQRATVLHEVLHAVAHTVGIDDEVELTQEAVIGRIDGILLGVLRDNPDLVAYLSENV